MVEEIFDKYPYHLPKDYKLPKDRLYSVDSCERCGKVTDRYNYDGHGIEDCIRHLRECIDVIMQRSRTVK